MRMKRISPTDESGAAIVIVVLALFALCGMVVLVVDVGGLLALRRQMVTASDSAALAAAQSCAREDPEEAAAQADILATENRSDAAQEDFQTTNCGTSSEGDVQVSYAAPKELVFAPLLGYPSERPVSATAHAIWGPTGGIGPVPIEFSVDPSGRIPCVRQEVGTQCNYWHDNNAALDLSNSSSWGFMNLNTAGVAAGDSCPSSGSSQRRDWITGDSQKVLTIQDPFTYVCVDSGHSTSSWMSALESQVGKIKYFPVNDPAHMVRAPSGKAKYAIIGFVALKIEAVLKGNDPAAVGTAGARGKCSTTRSFTPGSAYDLDVLACVPSGATISNIAITRGNGSKKVTYVQGVDYTFDPATHLIRWLTSAAANASISFDWSKPGATGACGYRDPDPNGVCLVTSWQGVQIGGSLPGNGRDFGLRAVRLDG